jgi:hypothetical protein
MTFKLPRKSSGSSGSSGSTGAGPAARTAGYGRRAVILSGLLAAAALPALAVAGPAAASVRPNSQIVSIGGTAVSVRDCYHPSKQPYPSTSCTFQATLEAGLQVTLVCQYAGQSISGDAYWDYVLYPATASHGSGQGYVSDWYVNTGISSAPYRDPNVPLCSY